MNWVIGLVVVGAAALYYEMVYKPAHQAGPSGGATITDPKSIADAQQMLASWAPTQGEQYSQTDLQSYWVGLFQTWANKGGVPGSALRTDGVLDAATLATLQYWFQTAQAYGPLAATTTGPGAPHTFVPGA